jgi:hypothetical protein
MVRLLRLTLGACPRTSPGYPAAVVSIMRLRRHLPLVVFIFLVLLAVMLVGLACACFTDHPMQAIEKALSVIPAAPPMVEVWPALVLGLFAGALVLTLTVAARGRSPALLQRFLF